MRSAFFFRWLVTKSIGNEKQTRVIFRLELMFCFSCYLDTETKHKRFSEWNDDDDIEIEQILHHQGDSSVITHQSFFFSRLYIFKLNIIVFFSVDGNIRWRNYKWFAIFLIFAHHRKKC